MVTVISSDLKVSMEDLEDEDCPSVLFGCFYKKGSTTLTKNPFANSAEESWKCFATIPTALHLSSPHKQIEDMARCFVNAFSQCSLPNYEDIVCDIRITKDGSWDIISDELRNKLFLIASSLE